MQADSGVALGDGTCTSLDDQKGITHFINTDSLSRQYTYFNQYRS